MIIRRQICRKDPRIAHNPLIVFWYRLVLESKENFPKFASYLQESEHLMLVWDSSTALKLHLRLNCVKQLVFKCILEVKPYTCKSKKIRTSLLC